MKKRKPFCPNRRARLQGQEIREDPLSLLDDPVGQKILLTLLGRGKRWRTVGGIAREAGLQEAVVVGCFTEHPEAFIECPLKLGGTALYGLSEQMPPQFVRVEVAF